MMSIAHIILADGDDADTPTLNPGTFHVPSFHYVFECRPHISRFNIFSSVSGLQTKCGGNFDSDDNTNDGVICGDSRRPWCSNAEGLSQCVTEKPEDDANIEWAYSLPTEAELTDCLEDNDDCVNDAWKTSIPTATLTVDDVDSTIQCLPTPNEMPTFCGCHGNCAAESSDPEGNGSEGSNTYTSCSATNSILAGWPDALRCGQNMNNPNYSSVAKGMVFELYEVTDTTVTYRVNVSNVQEIMKITYNRADKTYLSDDSTLGPKYGHAPYPHAVITCKENTLDEVIGFGLAIYFNPTKAPSNTGSLHAYKPDIIRCGQTGFIFKVDVVSANHSIYRPIQMNDMDWYSNPPGMDHSDQDFVQFNADGSFHSRSP